ncbi:MAG: hypothetical protein OXP71_00935 [Candidatus Poribacteria bacterium]|nr:hypothetical protein [Candidatus Poribacteria bacterium]
MKFEQFGTKWAYIYTTRSGIRYKFETVDNLTSTKQVLTEISDPNGNRVKLHYEAQPETPARSHRYPRLAAVEDSLGRILKFSYDHTVDDDALPRFITKIEFGLGTSTALTTVYNTVEYGYTRYRRHPYYSTSGHIDCLTAMAHQLGTGDPRGSEVRTQYEYVSSDSHGYRDFGSLAAVVSPLGYRTEYHIYERKVSSVRARDVADYNSDEGTVLHERLYSTPYTNSMTVYSKNPVDRTDNTRRRHNRYRVNTGQITEKYYGWRLPDYFSWRWSYANTNVTSASHYDNNDSQLINGTYYTRKSYFYRIYYEGADSTHNRQMGNATKWEQYHSSYRTPSNAARKWEADYETKYNRPIWQIDPMGHRTEFSYDDKGNLTAQRSKANTGTQPVAVDHDIITIHQYDAYGNRIKTTFMPDTTQEKVVETVYDSIKHTYPIEVKTTVTVNGADHIIKTKSEWDTDRGLKTADIDAQGRRTEYAYWQDGALKFTRRVVDDLYSIPTYDKNGRVTQTQVRQSNWQTGRLIAQTKTEYDAMGRVTRTHSFNNDDWTTPYATTESMYDVFGDLSQTKDPRGLLTTYTRDFLGRVTKQTLPGGDWVETRYNSIDQITKAWTSQTGSETSPAVSNTYDNLNRISQVSYSTGETVSYTYDRGDNVLTQATNDGSETYTYTFTHDQLNRIITQDNSLLGYKTFYEYDDASMRTRMSIQPSSGGTKVYDATYTYDEANRLLSVRDALAGKTASYGYFDIGALKTATNPNGITAHRTLDNLNRLDTVQYMKTATEVLSSLDYAYDVKSNVIELERDDTGAGGANKIFSFCYDNLSRLITANYGDGIVMYTYDKSGNRMAQISSIDGTTAYTVAPDSNQLTYRSLVPEDSDFSTMNYTYDAEGKLTQRSEGNDSDALSYGFGSRLTQIQKTRGGTLQQTISYAYDGGGKRVKVTDSGGTRYFLYDGLMPLLELDANKKIAASYLYGADGVVYRRKHNAAAHWHFDEGTGTVSHDVDGQHNGTLGDGDTNKAPAWSTEDGSSLQFDGTNDVLKVRDSDALDLVGNTLTISCRVKRAAAASGYLLKKSDASNGYRLWITSSGAVQFDLLFSGTTKTVTSATTIPLNTWAHVSVRYNGSDMNIFINGTKESASTAATGSLVATTAALWMGYYDGASHHLNGYLNEVSIYDRTLTDTEMTDLANNRVGRYEYHYTNALGSNIVLTDGNKNVLARYEYDVFGAVRNEVGTGDTPRKFTGKEYDSDVKLYYYGARYYDPYTGRFTQRDPAGDGINWYAYAANNPMKFIDPTGMYIVLPGGTEIRDVPEIDADGNYIMPDGLSSSSQTVWNSMFTGGINGTGIAGSETAGGMLAYVINSDRRVEIRFREYSEESGIFGESQNLGELILVDINTERKAEKLTITLLHELSHVHDYMTVPADFVQSNPYHASFVSELKAYGLGAKYAREMDRENGNYKFGSYSRATQFERRHFTPYDEDGNRYGPVGHYGYNSTSFYMRLHALARGSAH